jgi:signal transduction histidine kinase
MRLADFILAETETILQKWEEFARSIEPPALTMTSKELRNHAAAMLKTIAEDLGTSQTKEEQFTKSIGKSAPGRGDAAGQLHGIAREQSGFTIEQMVSEYRALRASVLQLWGERHGSALSTSLEDMTRFNEAIDQLQAASIASFAASARQAVEEHQRKDEFLAMLAHELRNPLSPISSAASMLKLAKGDEVLINKASDIITRQVTHMKSLIDDLLDVSRVRRGLIELKQEPVDVRRIVTDAVEQVTPLIESRCQQLILQEAPHIAVVYGDDKRLVQILVNVLTNAAKYTPEQGHITLKTEVTNAEVLLSAEDDGIGMAPQLIAHVFDLFTQAKRTPDRSSGGLGIGLTLVKTLVEMHRGSVSCSSAGLGKGSQFTIRLPRVHGYDDKVERRRAARDLIVTGKRLKILIVEDNVDAAQALCIVLKNSGHEVIVAHDPLHALDVALTEIPEVGLLDIGLPAMDGNELARRLRAQPETADMFLIATTGYGQEQDHQRALVSGFDHHMTKPVDTAELFALLATFR